jgi:hypothetical protein
MIPRESFERGENLTRRLKRHAESPERLVDINAVQDFVLRLHTQQPWNGRRPVRRSRKSTCVASDCNGLSHQKMQKMPKKA